MDAKEIIQKALENIQRPEKITDKQWEYYKAGVRAVVFEVNKILKGE